MQKHFRLQNTRLLTMSIALQYQYPFNISSSNVPQLLRRCVPTFSMVLAKHCSCFRKKEKSVQLLQFWPNTKLPVSGVLVLCCKNIAYVITYLFLGRRENSLTKLFMLPVKGCIKFSGIGCFVSHTTSSQKISYLLYFIHTNYASLNEAA